MTIKIQIINDNVVAYGIQLEGEGVIEIDSLPSDIDYVRYKYIDGQFIAQPSFDDFV
jgi:hypothetical protein